jgi:hypothetical protein
VLEKRTAEIRLALGKHEKISGLRLAVFEVYLPSGVPSAFKSRQVEGSSRDSRHLVTVDGPHDGVGLKAGIRSQMVNPQVSLEELVIQGIVPDTVKCAATKLTAI